MSKCEKTEIVELNSTNRNNTELKQSFNELINSVFSFTFEEWEKDGYWDDLYTPIVMYDTSANEVLANVSVAKLIFNIDGENVEIYQLGGVSSLKKVRGKGYAKALMEYVKEKYKNDTLILYANENVPHFYEKFGLEVHGLNVLNMLNIPSDGEKADSIAEINSDNLKTYAEKAAKSVQSENTGIAAFNINGMKLIKKGNTEIIAEYENGKLDIYAVLCDKNFSYTVESLVKSIRGSFDELNTVHFHFKPLNAEGLERTEIHEEDTVFMMKDTAKNLMKLGMRGMIIPDILRT